MPKLKEKSLRVIEFSGKKSDWKIWSVKWLARASKKGYKRLVDGTAAIPNEHSYQTACVATEPTPLDTK